MPSRSLADLAPELQLKAERFIAQCKNKNLNVIIICTYRSSDEQNKSFAQGREDEGDIVTYARGGQSPHNVTKKDGTPCSLAFDFVPIRNGKCVWSTKDPSWAICIDIAKSLGLESGSNWPKPKTDTDHLQIPNWKKYRDDNGLIC